MRLLFIFLDGIGLGESNPAINPLAGPALHNLEKILDGHKLIADDHFAGVEEDFCLVNTQRASLLALDACLGVEGIPQSATGQASLMTGKNVSAWLGRHEGPKPTPPIIALIQNGTLFSKLQQQNKAATLLNAFPPRYFETVEAGYRIPGVIALSARQAGVRLKTLNDLNEGKAISADFTAEGWRSSLGFTETPVLSKIQAAERLFTLTGNSDLAIFEYWLTDVAGHHQDMQLAHSILETIDAVLGSLLNSWDDDNNLILITSDHGNFEDLSTRHHTRNDVPLLLIGASELRERFIQQLRLTVGSRHKPDLTDIAPAIINFLE
ncbi:MAG: alkaline phosphatase family protein [Anaerolineales bacterium]